MSAPIYLDYQATTPVAPEAAAAMRPWLEENFANPHSPHRPGREAAAAIEVARAQVLTALGPAAGAGRLHFTSGATEAANWALKGSGAKRIVTLATEHACVLDTVEWLVGQGHDVEILPVGADGLVDLDRVEARVTPGTGLVAAMLVNNEIGAIQPIAEVARIARANGALFLCDAVQGFGRVPLPLEACDLVALSAHKIHGPKGIGALWVRDGVALEPLLHGGGQEGGVRSGTLSPMLCAGFGAAAAVAANRMEIDADHVFQLFGRANNRLGGWVVNGPLDYRYFGNLNIRRDGLDVARLMSDLRDIAFSAGSACASGSGRPSHVLRAIGLSEAQARSSIRLGFGRYTTGEQLEDAIERIVEAAWRQSSFAA